MAFLVLTLPGNALAAICPKPDPAAVVKTMTDMFAALTLDAGAKLAAIFTPDTVEFDGGTRFTGSALWDLIKTVHAKGIRLVWTLQDTDVHFACDTAWIDYINRGSVSDGKTTTPVTWLESRSLCTENRLADPIFALDAGASASACKIGGTCSRFAPKPVIAPCNPRTR